jgi:trehalose synthase
VRALREVEVPVLPLERLQSVIGDERHAALLRAGGSVVERLRGRTVWNVNSTASGGGVAEMLQVLVGYIKSAGVDIRWLVIDGDAPFFAITKRIHNRVHGSRGDGGELGEAEAAHYEEVSARNAGPLLDRVRAGDIVLLHDPQTAGLAAPLEAADASVVWRCHIGADRPNEWTEEAWRFLQPFATSARAFVFSRQPHVPAWAAARHVAIIPPSIDPLSPKNQDLDDGVVRRVLQRCALLAGEADSSGGAAEFTRRDGKKGRVVHAATVVSAGPLPDPSVPLVVQVSRWDRLKDMRGVLDGFASRVVKACDAHLALVGPSVVGVTDDPEGAEVLAECTAAWEDLPAEARARIHLVTLPMDDVDENAAMVNALQRHASVVVQKSLAEGFGLTVAEGMWKGNPVVASAVGGIVDQVVPGTGVLLDDPTDLDAFGDAVVGLLADPDELRRMGERARAHVLDEFAGDRHLLRYAELMADVLAG